ncbi:hypothetical protein PSPO01_12150 [Paraphaeosphaeria sporulosa]
MLLLFLVVSTATATLYTAKRSIGQTCGFSPVDCGNGWCCIAAQKCIPGDPPWCQDLLIPNFSIEAAPYSDLDPVRLTSLGLTISASPSTTFTATDALPTDSHTEVDTTSGSRSLLFTKPTVIESVIATASTGGGASPTLLSIHAIGAFAAACAGLFVTG